MRWKCRNDPARLRRSDLVQPLFLASMSGVEPAESGLASGVVNTAQMMGGAVGFAVLVTLVASRTDSLAAPGTAPSRRSTAGITWRSRSPPSSLLLRLGWRSP